MTYPLRFRQHVLAVREKEGLTILEASSRFQIGVATLTRWLKEVEPKATTVRPWLKIDFVSLARDIREYPDAYLHERAALFNVSHNAIFKALKRMGVTYKKTKEPSARGRTKAAFIPGEDEDL